MSEAWRAVLSLHGDDDLGDDDLREDDLRDDDLREAEADGVAPGRGGGDAGRRP